MPDEHGRITEADMNGPDPMRRAMDKYGITPDFLARKLAEELDANEIKVFKATVTDLESKEIVTEIIYSKPLIAWDVRQKARIDAQRLRGAYPAEKHEHDVKGFTLSIKNA